MIDKHPIHRAFDPMAAKAMDLVREIDELRVDAPFSTVQFSECWFYARNLRDALIAFADSVRNVR